MIDKKNMFPFIYSILSSQPAAPLKIGSDLGKKIVKSRATNHPRLLTGGDNRKVFSINRFLPVPIGP